MDHHDTTTVICTFILHPESKYGIMVKVSDAETLIQAHLKYGGLLYVLSTWDS